MLNRKLNPALKRIVITGIGALTPIGSTPEACFEARLKGKSGVRLFNKQEVPNINDLQSQIAGIVDFDLEPWLEMMPCGKNRQNALAFYSAVKAIEDSKFRADASTSDRFGVSYGSCTSSLLPHLDECIRVLKEKKPSTPYIESADFVSGSRVLSKFFGARGPCLGLTTACSSGQTSITESVKSILLDDADIMVAAGSESSIYFDSMRFMQGIGMVVTKFNHAPEEGSRPFDRDRYGVVGAEGGSAVVVEELNHALRRGAKIYAEILGFSSNNEAFHLSRPTDDGRGLGRTMMQSAERAGIKMEDIKMISTHATSTPGGDLAEFYSIRRAFGELKPYVTACKGNTGHFFGGTGGYHVIETVLAMQQGVIPPIKNLENPIYVDGKTLNFVTSPVKVDIEYAVSNNLGFGGYCNSIVLGKYRS